MVFKLKNLHIVVSALIAFTLLSISTLSWSFDKTPFTAEKFSALQDSNKVILIDVYADWCGTCKKQQLAINDYLEKHPERELHILEVDFDKQKDVVKMLGAPRQSTLLLYKGSDQFWFSVAESRPDMITSRIEQAFDFVPKT